MKAFGERVLVKKVYEDDAKGGILLSKERVYKDVVEVYSLGSEFQGALLEGQKLKLTAGAGAEVIVEEVEYLSILKNHIIGYM